MTLETGLRAEAEQEVVEAQTARSLGSGDVDVLGTPAVAALCERAAVFAVRPWLDEGQTTVGVRISLDHLAPTPVGRHVKAFATLESIDGRTLEFSVEACDDKGVVARGLHTRVIVQRDEFMRSAASR